MRARRRVGVDRDELLEALDFVRVAETFQADHGRVDLAGEVALFVVNESETARHTGAEVGAGAAEDGDEAARHVFATVVTHAFDDSGRAGVTNTEAFACAACGEEIAAGGTIQTGVTDDGVFEPLVTDVLRRTDDDFAAVDALADVVVGLADEGEA